MAGNSTDPGRSVTSKVTAILMAFTDDAVLIGPRARHRRHHQAVGKIDPTECRRSEEGAHRSILLQGRSQGI